MNHLPNDSALPALADLFDWSVITTGFRACQALATVVPGCDQLWQVTQCQHLRYYPGAHCTATYTLRQEAPGQPPRQTIGVVDCTSAGLAYRPFTQDDALPWLTTAVDPTVMAERLATLACAAPQERQQFASAWCITPIRYRPGERCALHYSRQSGTGTQAFFGKLLRQLHPQRTAALPTLHALTDQEPALPRLPHPLAHWPDLHLLIQPAVSGAEFHAVVFDETQPIRRRVQWFSHMGAKVAALHTVAPIHLPTRTVTDEWPELIAAHPLIERLLPSLAPIYLATLTALRATAASLPTTTPVICHGALRTDQFLLRQSDQQLTAEAELLLIDLDTLCLADPACDIGNCLAYLAWKAIRQPRHADLIRQASAAFLAGYSTMRQLPHTATLAFYQALALLKIAGRRFSNLSYREWPLTPSLVQAAAALLPDQPTTNRMVTTL